MIFDSYKNIQDMLVSIIIPAYNVEQYIEKCLLSIIRQSFTNLEVIVVDDGSTDKTGQLIDAFVKQDCRVRVIHKKNAGVSTARNIGIEASAGDYLVFVDADDYLAQDYIEYMISLVTKTEAEFCLSKYCFTKNDEKQVNTETIEKLSPEEATVLLLSPDVIVGCWNKIFKRSLIIENEIRFSNELFYGEGLNFIITMSQVSNSVGVGNRKVYYYRRNNINSATTKFSIEKFNNGEKAIEVIRQHLIFNSSKINTMLELHYCLFCLNAITTVLENHLEKQYLNDYKRWRSQIKHNTIRLVLKTEISTYIKFKLFCVWISPWIMMKLATSKRKYVSANSV